MQMPLYGLRRARLAHLPPSVPMLDATQMQARTIPPCYSPARLQASGFTTDCSAFRVAPVCLSPLFHRAWSRTPALECQPDGARPYGRKHFFGSPKTVPPKQVLAPGPYAPRPRKGTAGMGSALNW